MAGRQRSIDLDPSTYRVAKDMAEKEHVTIESLLASLVRDRAEYIDNFRQTVDGDRFSLVEWEMNRSPGESDEDYESRLNLFR